MIKSVLQFLIQIFSRLLRKTPLRKLRWVTTLQDKLFGSMFTTDIIELDGFSLEMDPRDKLIKKKLTLYGEYEEYTRNVISSSAITGSIAIDVGANVGLHTIPLSAKVGKSGRVIAFEPDPDNYNLLRRNIKNNNLLNVTAYNIGLSSKTEVNTLYQSSTNRGSLSLCKDNVEGTSPQLKPITIELTTADEFLKDLSLPVSLIKIDVEGAEPLVLQGMTGLLNINPDAIIVFEFIPEYVNNFGIVPLDFLKWIENLGYTLSLINEEEQKITVASAEEIVNSSSGPRTALNLLAKR